MNKNKLINLIKTTPGVINYGEFRLSSGLNSNYFIDLSKLLFKAPALTTIAYEVLKQIPKGTTHIGGPAYGVDVLLGTILNFDSDYKGFLVRKEAKNGDYFEGFKPTKGDSVVIIEDVVTTGKQVLKCCDLIEAEIIGIISILDRNQGAREILKNYKYLCSIEEIMNQG